MEFLNKIIHGDCLEIMPRLPDKSVDMILCDLPYGTTDIRGWDKVIPAPKMWEQYLRIIKDNGNVVLFGSQPFTSFLISSNPDMFRYEWIWNKTRGANFLNANRQPMKAHENILVFSKLPASPNKKGTAQYYPQKTTGESYVSVLGKKTATFNGGAVPPTANTLAGRHPITILTHKKDGRLHPTQKPVALCEFLIRSYTEEGAVVLDNCIGSGTTAVAAIRTGRNFVGIEKEARCVDVALERIQGAVTKIKLNEFPHPPGQLPCCRECKGVSPQDCQPDPMNCTDFYIQNKEFIDARLGKGANNETW